MTLLRPNGDPELAYRLGLEALAAARADPGAGMEINCHIVLGRTALVRCQPDEALPHFERALAKSPQGSNDRAVAASWIGRTKLWGKGDPLGARPPLRQAIMLLRLQGEQEGLIDALQALGIAESTLGQHVLAVRLFAEARDIARSLSLPDQQLAAMQALADCQFTWGDLAAARAEVTTIVGNASLAECNEVSMAWSLLAAIELEDGDFGAARNAAEEALATCTTWTINNIAEVWALLAEVEWLDGRPDEAQRAAHTALLQPDHDSTWWARARAEAVLAGASGDHGPLARALAPQVNLLTGPQLLVAARSLRRLGIDTAQSRRLSERAHKHASRIGAGHWL
jgi:tetratricopeptide (TPR) repeat protein